MAARGLAGFSARAAARAAGYAVGTIYHVFGSLDAYILAINTRSLADWAASIDEALAACASGEDRIAVLVRAYFAFARTQTARWEAIFAHRRPPGLPLDPDGITERATLTAIIDREVAAALDVPVSEASRRLTRSLIATVHGHCALALGGSYALMGEDDPEGQALARVRDSLAAQQRR